MVLDEANGLPQHRSAHAKAFLQSVFGTQRFSDRPATANDVRLDLAGDRRSQLFCPSRGRRGAYLKLNTVLPQAVSTREQHATRDRTAAHGNHADLGALRHLPLPRFAAQLQTALV